MRSYKEVLKKYMRLRDHIFYVESRVVELRRKICNQAVKYGNVSIKTRKQYLKYNEYLRKLKDGRK